VPVWSAQTAVFKGPVTAVDLATVPLTSPDGLRNVLFDRAAVHALTLPLDEVHLDCQWSSFDGCTFTQRSRRLHRDGFEPQGSFGSRPSLYRDCRFVGVRFRLRAGFGVGEARFENCVFERCRFEEHFSDRADYVGCRFIGPVKMAVFFGCDPQSGRRNDITGNDFTQARFTDNVAWRRDFPLQHQHWPTGFTPLVDDA
jgi:hypothetical protein